MEFETLSKEFKGTRWYPTSINIYKTSIDFKSEDKNLLKSNFAYSMQYLEYLDLQFKELNLSSVLYTMLIKSYIITGMGIIEGIFTDVLKSNNLWNKSTWEESFKIETNPKKDSATGDTIKVVSQICKKVNEYDLRMDLDSMIKKIESKKLLSIDHDDFPVMKQLRQLRNRVHLQLGQDSYDHDYNNFNYEDLKLMRRILFNTLTCIELCKRKKVFEFLDDN